MMKIPFYLLLVVLLPLRYLTPPVLSFTPAHFHPHERQTTKTQQQQQGRRGGGWTCTAPARSKLAPSFVPKYQRQPLQSIASHGDQPYDAFDLFTKMRLGVGEGPGSSNVVFWVGQGSVYQVYSGKILAHFEGFDVGRGVRMKLPRDDTSSTSDIVATPSSTEGKEVVRQLSRKIFWFRHAETNQLLTEYNGDPVRPIQYDCQVFDYQRGGSDGVIIPSVVNSQRQVPVMPITSLFIQPKNDTTSSGEGASSPTCIFQAPVFVDLTFTRNTSDGSNVTSSYKAWEFYDYTVDCSFSPQRPLTATWCRQGPTPPFGDPVVMKFVGHRVDRFTDLPPHMQTLVRETYPLYSVPPTDMAEVDRLTSTVQPNASLPTAKKP